jgi:hypothetical protein
MEDLREQRPAVIDLVDGRRLLGSLALLAGSSTNGM